MVSVNIHSAVGSIGIKGPIFSSSKMYYSNSKSISSASIKNTMKSQELSFDFTWTRPSDDIDIQYEYQQKNLISDEDLGKISQILGNNPSSESIMDLLKPTSKGNSITIKYLADSNLIASCIHGGRLSAGIRRPYDCRDGEIVIDDESDELQINYVYLEDKSPKDAAATEAMLVGLGLPFQPKYVNDLDFKVPSVAVYDGSEMDTLLLLRGFVKHNVYMRKKSSYLENLLPKNVCDLMAHVGAEPLTNMTW